MTSDRTRRWPAQCVIAALLAGCAATPIPEAREPQSAGLAITVEIAPPMGIGSLDPEQLYFARVDNADGLEQQTIVRSNLVRDNRAYLLNARPGTYVAVASMSHGVGMRSGNYTTYFPKEVLEQTRATVREGEIAYMGSMVLETSIGFDNADEIQNHYKNVLAPGAPTDAVQMGFRGDVHYRGGLVERKPDDRARSEFLAAAREDLAGSAWLSRIE